MAVEVVSTKTTADVMWKDGCLERSIRSNSLIPVQHLDTHEFCPGDFVVDKRRKNPWNLVTSSVCFIPATFQFLSKCFWSLQVLNVVLCVLVAQALPDPGVYGVIQSGDHKARTCVVKWMKLNSSSDDVEVRL